MDWDKMFPNQPVTVSAKLDGDNVIIYVNPNEGKMNKLDINGRTETSFNLLEIKRNLYQTNIEKLITTSPNPVSENENIAFNIKENVIVYGYYIYDLNGTLLESKQNLEEWSKMPNIKVAQKGTYYLLVNINGSIVKGGILLVK
ncbi:MAG: hypothetical protein FGM41_12150 [Bacteroidetes bacterium]|nr:hypothetical protein [Bacteroidota bacterium]